MSESDEYVTLLREAIRLTREYVGERMLPAVSGFTWFDAVGATGGYEGFGGCGCVLNPKIHGRTPDGKLRFCTLPAGHEGAHSIYESAENERP